MNLKNDVIERLHNTDLFSITYKKDKFVICEKEYPIGYTSYLVMNDDCRYIDETFFEELREFTKVLLDNEFNRESFLDYYNKINSAIDMLNHYEIFRLLAVSKYKEKIDRLFTEEKIKLYEEYNQLEQNEYRIKISKRLDKVLKVSIDLELAFSIGFFISSAVKEVKQYSSVVFQMTNKIVNRNARTKSNLAKAFNDFLTDPYLNFIFDVNSNPFSTKATLTPIVESDNGNLTIYRNIYYNNLKDFLMTDLFEGYIHGHYLWRCDICDRYFFMTTAHNQLYCSTVNKEYGVPCSYVAKHPEITKRKMTKQRKSDSSYYVIWKRRNDSIRKNKSLGKYSEEVSTKAKKIIDMKFEKAQIDFDYAENQYEDEMKLKNIYSEAIKSL
jgi:hypothetical protein